MRRILRGNLNALYRTQLLKQVLQNEAQKKVGGKWGVTGKRYCSMYVTENVKANVKLFLCTS